MAKNPWWAPWVLSRLIEPMMRELTAQIPGIAGMKAGERALDVCCGTGGLAFLYARMGVIATGIDMDHRVIHVAERRRSELNLPNASFQTASALELPFEDHCFDHVSIAMSIHEVERSHRDAIIWEMKRVVRNPGTLLFLDYMVPMPQRPSSWAARFTEFASGRDHNRCFLDYIKQGGLMALLKRHHLSGEKKSELSPMEIVLAKMAAVYQ
jgi:ubiquinone/menaquinone biosynthesis C-methylase UbiE